MTLGECFVLATIMGQVAQGRTYHRIAWMVLSLISGVALVYRGFS